MPPVRRLHGVAGRGCQLFAVCHPPVKVRYQLLIHIGIADAGIQIRRQLIVQRIAAGRQRGIHCGGHLGHQAVIQHAAAHGHPQLQHLRQLLIAGAHLRPEVDGDVALVIYLHAVVLGLGIAGEHIGHGELPVILRAAVIQPDGDLAGPGRCGNGCAGGLRRRLDAVAGGLCRPACLPPVIPHGTQRRKAQRQQDRQHNDQPLHRAASNGLPHL